MGSRMDINHYNGTKKKKKKKKKKNPYLRIFLLIVLLLCLIGIGYGDDLGFKLVKNFS